MVLNSWTSGKIDWHIVWSKAHCSWMLQAKQTYCIRPWRSHMLLSQSIAPHLASMRLQGNMGFPKLLFTMLCTLHIHCASSKPEPTFTGLDFSTSLKWSAHSLHGYIRESIDISSLTSRCCCLVGLSGNWAASVCKNVQVARPSSSFDTGPVHNNTFCCSDCNCNVCCSTALELVDGCWEAASAWLFSTTFSPRRTSVTCNEPTVTWASAILLLGLLPRLSLPKIKPAKGRVMGGIPSRAPCVLGEIVGRQWKKLEMWAAWTPRESRKGEKERHCGAGWGALEEERVVQWWETVWRRSCKHGGGAIHDDAEVLCVLCSLKWKSCRDFALGSSHESN